MARSRVWRLLRALRVVLAGLSLAAATLAFGWAADLLALLGRWGWEAALPPPEAAEPLAAVAKANHGKTKLSATIVGNASLVASQCVQVVGLGKLSGKYYIDTITHNVSGSGGYTMDLEMSLVEE